MPHSIRFMGTPFFQSESIEAALEFGLGATRRVELS